MNKSKLRPLSERGWERLLIEIKDGNVIPVIGSELFSIEVEDEKIQLDEYILRKMSDAIEVEYSDILDYTQLASKKYAVNWDEIDSDPYYHTVQILKEMSNLQVKSSEALRKLLSIDKFKLVLTTSFDDWAYGTMEEKWGKGNVRSLYYKKRSLEQDIDNLSIPTIYHMFGKADVVPHSFVLTEDDLLEFLHYWLNDNYRPKRLANTLREKYLLVIGCNYPNWLFRFFIHSMKYSSSSYAKNEFGMVADSKLDNELIAFLSRIDAQMHDNAVSFIDELVERWQKYSDQGAKKEIFISYASEDYDVTKEIVNTFEKMGVNVWFDKKELEPADEYAVKIEKEIRESQAFIPILSKNTLISGRRFFKREWKWGEEEIGWRGLEKFVYPIVIDDVDLSSSMLPNIFRDAQIIDYNNINYENNIKKIVRDIRLK